MKIAPLLPLMLIVLCGCAPGSDSGAKAVSSGTSAGVVQSSGDIGVARPAPPDTSAPSYEVSIASAQADRVRARDQCDSQPLAERKSCREAADHTYDQAKSAADASDTKTP